MLSHAAMDWRGVVLVLAIALLAALTYGATTPVSAPRHDRPAPSGGHVAPARGWGAVHVSARVPSSALDAGVSLDAAADPPLAAEPAYDHGLPPQFAQLVDELCVPMVVLACDAAQTCGCRAEAYADCVERESRRCEQDLEGRTPRFEALTIHHAEVARFVRDAPATFSVCDVPFMDEYSFWSGAEAPGACAGDEPPRLCQGGFCEGGQCHPVHSLGGACGEDQDCLSSWCARGICLAPGQLGAACDDEGDLFCAQHLACLEGRCRPGRREGQDCDENADCHPSLRCGGEGRCERASCAGVVLVEVSLDDTHRIYDACGAGEVCRTQISSRCVPAAEALVFQSTASPRLYEEPLRGPGERCGPGCRPGLHCGWIAQSEDDWRDECQVDLPLGASCADSEHVCGAEHVCRDGRCAIGALEGQDCSHTRCAAQLQCQHVVTGLECLSPLCERLLDSVE